MNVEINVGKMGEKKYVEQKSSVNQGTKNDTGPNSHNGVMHIAARLKIVKKYMF